MTEKAGVPTDGAAYVVRVCSLGEWYARMAAVEDALPQDPPREDPQAVLADESGFRTYLAAHPAATVGDILDRYEEYFRDRTGIRVCACWRNEFAYRPAHVRDVRGVWRSWDKHPRWLKTMLKEGGG